MIEFECIVQEGCVPQDLRPDLTAELARISSTLLNEPLDSVTVQYTDIPKGSGFRASEPSTTSLVGGTIPPGCTPELRTKLMRQVEAMWCEITGCSTHDLVISAVDRKDSG